MLSFKRKLPKGLAIASQSREFWRRMAPELTISDLPQRCGIAARQDQVSRARIRLVNDGFLHLKNPGLDAPLERIAAVMDRIVKTGMPAAFIAVYDEVWSIISEMQPGLDELLDGGAALVPSFWASHTEEAGSELAATRRRAGNGVFSDGTAKNLTIWMPLTTATPENGCMYVVPAGQDRNYGRAGAPRADAALPGIRALPAKAGDILIWSGETYHWQSRPHRHNEDGPLMSLNWEVQSKKTQPLEGLVIDSFSHVPFETRLAILARQMPRSFGDRIRQPVWHAVQRTLANRFPLDGLASQA